MYRWLPVCDAIRSRLSMEPPEPSPGGCSIARSLLFSLSREPDEALSTLWSPFFDFPHDSPDCIARVHALRRSLTCETVCTADVEGLCALLREKLAAPPLVEDCVRRTFNSSNNNNSITAVADFAILCSIVERTLSLLADIPGTMLKDVFPALLASSFKEDVPPGYLHAVRCVLSAPKGINLRNLVWHGFVADGINNGFFDTSYTLLMIFFARCLAVYLPSPIGGVCARRSRSVVITTLRMKDFSVFSSGGDNDNDNDDYHSVVWTCTALEAVLRHMWVEHNGADERLHVAQDEVLYTTIDVVLSYTVGAEDTHPFDDSNVRETTHRRNALVDVLGIGLFSWLRNIFVEPTGPEIRARVAHFDVSPDAITSDIAACLRRCLRCVEQRAKREAVVEDNGRFMMCMPPSMHYSGAIEQLRVFAASSESNVADPPSPPLSALSFPELTSHVMNFRGGAFAMIAAAAASAPHIVMTDHNTVDLIHAMVSPNNKATTNACSIGAAEVTHIMEDLHRVLPTKHSGGCDYDDICSIVYDERQPWLACPKALEASRDDCNAVQRALCALCEATAAWVSRRRSMESALVARTLRSSGRKVLAQFIHMQHGHDVAMRCLAVHSRAVLLGRVLSPLSRRTYEKELRALEQTAVKLLRAVEENKVGQFFLTVVPYLANVAGVYV
eukprot:PhM_4_TR3395/c0_g1_i1/m.33208